MTIINVLKENTVLPADSTGDKCECVVCMVNEQRKQ